MIARVLRLLLPRPEKSPALLLLLPALLLITGIIGIGWYFSARSFVGAQEEAGRDLAAIADIKSDQVRSWLNERLGDAAVMSDSVRVRRLLAEPADRSHRDLVLALLNTFQDSFHYDFIAVFDARGNLLLSTSEEKLARLICLRAKVAAGLRNPGITLTEMHGGKDGEPVHFSLICPVQEISSGVGPVQGVVVMVVNPRNFLFPLMQRWPYSSRTGETLLVAREGASALFLNDTRLSPGSAMSQRVPLVKTADPAVRGVSGERGLLRGPDYRGMPVLAVARAIHGTAWVLVAKMDEKEVFMTFRREIWLIGGVIGFASLIILLVSWLVLREQRHGLLERQLVERQQKEAELKEHARRLSTLMANLPGMAYRCLNRPDWPMVFTSEGGVALTGYSYEDLTSNRPAYGDIIVEADREEVWQGVQRGIDRREPFELNYRIMTARGELRWVWERGRGVYSPEGELLFLEGFIIDTTEHKLAEAALQAERQRLESIIIGSDVGTWEWNVQTGETVFNERWAEMAGYTLAELAPISIKTWIRLAHAEDLKESDAALERHFRGETKRYECEVRIRHRNGHWIWVLDRGRVTSWTADGRPLFMQGTHTEITQLKLTEHALAEEAKGRRLLVEGSRDGIVVLDEDGKVYEANRQFAGMLGYTMEEVRELHVWDWDRNWPPERVIQAISDLGPEGARFETRHWRKDGSYLDVELSNSPAELGDRKMALCVCHDITERRRSEMALQESKQRLQMALDAARMGVWEFDFTEGRLYWSPEFFANLGLPPIEPSRERLLAMTHPDDVNVSQRALDRAIAAHSRYHCEYRVIIDGKLRWIEDGAEILRDGQGRPLRAIGTAHDITERKLAEAGVAREAMRTEFLLELHQRAPQMGDKELYDHVLERAVRLTDSAIGFFHQVSEDQKTIILTTWNKFALQSCTAAYDAHYPLNEAGNWVDCVRQQRAIIYNDFTHSPNQRGLPAGHTPLQRFMSIPVIREGKVRIIFGVGNKPADYNDEDLAQLQVVANELHKIMEQRSAQEQLLRSEERFRQLVENTSDLIWETDTAGRHTYVSSRIQDVLGYAPGELIGRGIAEFMAPSNTGSGPAAIEALLAKQEPFSGIELVLLHRDGSEVHLESSGAPMRGANGELVGYRGMDRDMTGRRRLESQLRQSQKLEAVGQLAGGVAHDFNNILAAMMMHLGMLQENRQIDDATRGSVAELKAAAQRAATLTRQLLMFSRRSVLALKPIDLNAVVADMLKMLGRLIGEQFELRFDAKSGLPAVAADAGMLEQVLMNLVVNARDAMAGGGRITIATSVESGRRQDPALSPSRHPGRFVCLVVSDTGIGMDGETMKRIFDPFFTTKEAGKGTGLGLATVHGIVAQHKGWVDVESTRGVGSTFRVYLPVAEQSADHLGPEAPAATVKRGSETVLVVEDDMIVRTAVRLALARSGYRVLEAANGQAAIEMWQRHGDDVDLLFTDMVMPEGITGLELVDLLRKRRADLKVIVSSGYSAEIVHAGIPRKKGVVYLPKPFTMATLCETVRRCLD